MLNQAEERALLELLAVCTTVFEEDPFVSPNALSMSLRRIQKSTMRAVGIFSSAPTYGAGRAESAGHSTSPAEHGPSFPTEGRGRAAPS